MSKKAKRWQQVLVSIIGGVGYLTWLVLLLVLVGVYFRDVQQSSVGKMVLPTYVPASTAPVDPELQTGEAGEPLALSPIIAVVLILGLVSLMAYVLFMRYIPAASRSAEKVVEKTAEVAVGQIERHHKKKLPKRKHIQLTEQVRWVVKLVISLVPAALITLWPASVLHEHILPDGSTDPMSYVIKLTIFFLCTWAVICFCTQTALMRLWGVAPQNSPARSK